MPPGFLHPRPRWNWLALGIAWLGLTLPAFALDEVVLKNGRRYLGTIVESTPTSIVLAIDGGTVEFPRSMIASPPYLSIEHATSSEGANAEPAETKNNAVENFAAHPLPSVADALRRLREFSWATQVRQVPVLVTDQGRWQYLPCISFWVADFFQLSFYGDPARPSAIEVSLHHPPPTAWQQKRNLLEYLLSLAPELALDNRFDRLDVRGDQYAVGDLWFEITSPDSQKTPGRWATLLLHEVSLKTARASNEELLAISELVPAATIDPTKPRSWQRASWLPDELQWVRQVPGAENPEADDSSKDAGNPAGFSSRGGERVYLRAFTRERGRYVRANTDWAREFAAAAHSAQ